jgi:N-acetylglucosaminyl-diphospho-decaprenol L-rhamnosyltransferase
MSMPSLDIVIVNWNAGPLLRRCLAALSGAMAPGFELRRVVVVDNASSDGSHEGLEQLPLPVAVIRNATNRGFGAACNQGAKSSTADYLLFLNPDAYVTSTSLSVPVAYLSDSTHGDVGVAGIQLRGDDGHIARSCAREPTPGVIAARILGLDVVFPRAVPSLFLTDWDHATTREVPHVIGAFYMIRRELFERLGGFDERFFVYLEDLDLSVRVRQSRHRIMFLADAYVEHTGGGTSDAVKASRIAYSLHSRVLYGYKHFGWLAATLLAAGTLLVEPLPRLARALARGSVSEVRDTLLGFARLWRRVFGLA